MILLKGMAKPGAFETARRQQSEPSSVGPQSESLVHIVLEIDLGQFQTSHDNRCMSTCSMKGCTNYYYPDPYLGQPV